MRDPAIFRVGIVGAGDMARRAHIPGWQSLPGVEVAALCAPDFEAASAVGEAFGIPNVFSDYRALMDLELDAVSICAPNNIHVPAALAALERGKHVLCEKPLAVTAAEVRALGEKSEAARRLLMARHQLRFAAPARAARAWVDAKKLGPVYHARVRALRRAHVPVSPGFTDKALAGGGPALDIGVHSLDVALWLMDFPRPVRVTGTVKTNFARGDKISGDRGEWDRARFSVEDFAAGFVHFENGATLELECSWLGHYPDRDDMSCRLFGLEGSLCWPTGEFSFTAGKTHSMGILPSGSPESSGESAHFAAIRAFHEAIRDGKPSPIPWRESYWVIAIVEALYASAAEGKEVFLRGL